MSNVLCHYAQKTSSSVLSPTMTMSPLCGEHAWSQHVDGPCWRFLDVFQAVNVCPRHFYLTCKTAHAGQISN